MHFDFSNEKGAKMTCNKMVLDRVTKIVWDEQRVSTRSSAEKKSLTN